MSELAITDSFREQLPKNLMVNIASFMVSILVGIFLVPYFIGTLGIAAYGLIPLATSITSYVTIITDSLNISVSRFLTVDLQRQDYTKANKTFNTALFCVSGIILLSVPVVVLVSYYAPVFFSVPAGQESGVIWLFFGVFASFLVRSWSSNFTVSLFSYNRLDLLNLLNILSVLIQISLIVLLFTVFSPQLGYIGFAYLASSVGFLLGAIVLSHRINPHLHIDIQEFDRSRLRELTLLGWWAVVDQIGTLLLFQSELVVVNLLFGATATGEYAVVFLWVVLLRGISGTLSGVLNPMVLTYYAKEKIDQIIHLSNSAVKILGLFIALPIGLICGFAPYILTLWVGPEFVYLAPLMWVLAFPMIVSLCILPLFAINVAFNKVRIPGIITLIMGIVYVLLAFTLVPVLGWGYYGVGVIGAIVLTLRSGFFVPWYATKIMGIPLHTFTKSIVSGIAATLIIAGITALIGNIVFISTLIHLALFCGIISLAYFVAIWYIAFIPSEREILLSYIPKKMRGT